MRLALDTGGGDFGATVTVPAACDAVCRFEDIEIILVGSRDQQDHLLELTADQRRRLRFESAETVLPADVGPVAVVRQGHKSSLGRAMALVSERQADACISAGSTTALMTLGVRQLGMLPGLKRPALMSVVPSRSGVTALLDLGANVNVGADQLKQFAIMGTVARQSDALPSPSVGLLNVGHEDSKGSAVVREAHEQLKSLPINYIGFIEGNDIFDGRVDVAVCDGFSGNLILKSSEGLAKMMMGQLKSALGSSVASRLGSLLVKPALARLLERFDPAQHNGAPLLGLSGVVLKSHGSAGREATFRAIIEARKEVANKVPEQIRTLIKKYEAEALA